MSSSVGPLMASRRTTASHTIGVSHLSDLLAAVRAGSGHDAYKTAVIADNVLGRPTFEGRKRAFRHLRELYLLDEDQAPFRALRAAWADDPAAGPLLAGLMAFTHDELLRASWPAIAQAGPGTHVTSQDVSDALAASGVAGLGATTLAKAGRNIASSWTQTGHLVGRSVKHRVRVEAGPAAVAFAVTLGHLRGARGEALLSSPWFDLLDLPDGSRRDALDCAHRRGLIDVRSAGNMLEIGVGRLLDGGAR